MSSFGLLQWLVEFMITQLMRKAREKIQMSHLAFDLSIVKEWD